MNDGPAYERVADQLRDAILADELNGRLPSLGGLADRYGTTVDVARRAVDILRSEGLLVTRQGSGTYVRRFQRITRTSPARLAHEQWAAGRAIQDADTGVRPRTVDVIVSEVPAPDYVAEALGVQVGAAVLSRARRFMVDKRPVQISQSFIPLDIASDSRIAYTDVGPGGTYGRLAELGFAPVRFTERLTARAPRPDEVERLDLGSSVGATVIEITRNAYTEAGRCVEVNRMVLDATAYELVYAFDA